MTLSLGHAEEPPRHEAVTPAPRPDDWWVQRFEQTRASARQGNVDLVFVGDSITQGWEEAGKATWERYYAGHRALNIGFSGDRTQHVLWRLDHGNLGGITPKVVVVLIGTNNSNGEEHTAREMADGIIAVVERLRTPLPGTKVLLLAVFPRGPAPDAQRAKIAEANRFASRIADGNMIHYLDIGPSFLSPDQMISPDVMPDSLHLSAAGYEVWAKAMEPKLVELLGEPPASWQTDPRGQTGFFRMRNAPYPHASRSDGFRHNDKFFPADPHYVDSTVALFIPAGHRPGDRADLLLYFHGHYNNVRKALDQFRLREQVVASGKNVILVFPQGPKDAGDSGGGKLEEPDALRRLVDEVLDTLATGGKIPAARPGRVLLAGHSGAYRVLSFCLEHGGLDDDVQDVCLLDATYGRLDAFADWITHHAKGRLFSAFTEHLADENHELMAKLAAREVNYASRDDSGTGGDPVLSERVVFLATSRLDHDQTVQWLDRWLRSTGVPDR